MSELRFLIEVLLEHPKWEKGLIPALKEADKRAQLYLESTLLDHKCIAKWRELSRLILPIDEGQALLEGVVELPATRSRWSCHLGTGVDPLTVNWFKIS